MRVAFVLGMQTDTIGGAVFIAVALLAGCDNYIIQSEQEVNEAWGNLQAQLQRRADLVPNLVETVKGAAAHEKETLALVVQARSAATSIQINAADLNNPEKMAAFSKAQATLAQALRQVFAVAEAYPDLKANQSFRDLQVQLEGTENRIARSREQYNSAVQRFNTDILKWPGRWLAGGRTAKQVFEADVAAQKAPQVRL
jgi:LemA protein